VILNLLLSVLLPAAHAVTIPSVSLMNKQADESRAETTTLAVDSEMVAPFIDGDVFFFIFDFHAVSASAVPDIKWTIQESVIGSTMSTTCHATDAQGLDETIVMHGFGLAQTAALTANTEASIHCTGVIRIGVGTNIGFWWSQNTSNATATTVEQDSVFLLFFIAHG